MNGNGEQLQRQLRCLEGRKTLGDGYLVFKDRTARIVLSFEFLDLS